jgi:hypothetical protein
LKSGEYCRGHEIKQRPRDCLFLGTGLPFELGVRVGSFHRYWETGGVPSLTVVLKNNGIHPQEMTKTIFSVLKVIEMAFSNH